MDGRDVAIQKLEGPIYKSKENDLLFNTILVSKSMEKATMLPVEEGTQDSSESDLPKNNFNNGHAFITDSNNHFNSPHVVIAMDAIIVPSVKLNLVVMSSLITDPNLSLSDRNPNPDHIFQIPHSNPNPNPDRNPKLVIASFVMLTFLQEKNALT